MSDSPKEEKTNRPDEAEVNRAEETRSTESTPDTNASGTESELPSPPFEESSSAKAAPEKARCGKAGLVVGLVSLALIIGLAGFGHYRVEQLRDEFNQKKQTLNQALTSQTAQYESRLSAVSEDLNQAQLDREAQNVLVDRLQQRLSDAIKQVEAGRETSESDWRLAEAEYLLRLANQRILMERRPEGALAMLRATDEILRDLDDVTLFALREMIAKEIASLEAIPKLDVEGTYLRLAALIDQSGTLTTLSVEQQRELPNMLSELTPELIDETLQEEVQSTLSRALARLEKLVIVQNHDQAIEPLLSPEQGIQLRHSLQLLLEQTQLALLKQQQAIYDNSLNNAEQLITRYFDSKAANTQAILNAIKALKPLKVAPEMPDISGSLTLLQQHMTDLRKLGAGARS